MNVPSFYIVADGNAYAMEDDGYMFGAPVFEDNTVDWDSAYDFEPDESDVEYVAHMCKLLQDIKSLQVEHTREVFSK